MSLNLIYFIKHQRLFSFLCTSSEVGSCELADYVVGEKRPQELATLRTIIECENYWYLSEVFAYRS